MATLILHADLITWEEPNRILTNHAVYIVDGLIQDIGPSSILEDRYPAAERLDAHGQFLHR